MTIKKQKTNQHNLSKLYIYIALLVATLVFSATILVIMPSHFSLVAIILALTSLFTLYRVSNSKKIDQAYKGIILSSTYSLAYLLVILYWSHAGTSACSEFFGSYRSCLGSAQQVFVEIVAIPIILLTVTQPALKKRG